MVKNQAIISLKTNDSGPHEHGSIYEHIWRLKKNNGAYKIIITRTGDRGRKRITIPIDNEVIEKWLARLQKTKISLLPEGSSSCDGTIYTFTWYTDETRMTLCWHNVLPAGTKSLDRFCDWLFSLVPGEWDEIPPLDGFINP